MTFVEIPIHSEAFGKNSPEADLLAQAASCRATAEELFNEQRYMDALERTIEALRIAREFKDTESTELRALVASLLFDLIEIHFALKDYRQSEKELDVLFKVLEGLMKVDAERFGPFHILALELSTRILRSRKKTIDMLAKQQIAAGALYEKVTSGIVEATDKLVDSLCKVAELLASSGDYRAAMKFFAEAIKFSKKRAGKVTAKEVKMTIEMAKIMMRVSSMRERSKKLLAAVLPHAISLGEIALEEDILALIEVVDSEITRESAWQAFTRKITSVVKKKSGKEKSAPEKDAK